MHRPPPLPMHDAHCHPEASAINAFVADHAQAAGDAGWRTGQLWDWPAGHRDPHTSPTTDSGSRDPKAPSVRLPITCQS